MENDQCLDNHCINLSFLVCVTYYWNHSLLSYTETKGAFGKRVCASQTHVLRFCFFFFFFELKYLSFSVNSALCALFTDPQISLLSNFFIKNGSHGTIHTFKNYFAIVFFSFQFQFSTVSKRTLNIHSTTRHL